MSAPVLTKEQVKDIKRTWPEHTFVFRLADSHEALRAERDAALAEVERMRPVVEAADAAHLAAARVPIVNHQQEYISALADLWLAVESYRAKEPDHA